jgi:hypothetical protein
MWKYRLCQRKALWFAVEFSWYLVGFGRGWTEYFRLLSCYAAWGDLKPIIKGQACWTAWPLKMGPIGSSETSVSEHLAPRNNPENGRIQLWVRSCVRWRTICMQVISELVTRSRRHWKRCCVRSLPAWRGWQSERVLLQSDGGKILITYTFVV